MILGWFGDDFGVQILVRFWGRMPRSCKFFCIICRMILGMILGAWFLENDLGLISWGRFWGAHSWKDLRVILRWFGTHDSWAVNYRMIWDGLGRKLFGNDFGNDFGTILALILDCKSLEQWFRDDLGMIWGCKFLENYNVGGWFWGANSWGWL